MTGTSDSRSACNGELVIVRRKRCNLINSEAIIACKARFVDHNEIAGPGNVLWLGHIGDCFVGDEHVDYLIFCFPLLQKFCCTTQPLENSLPRNGFAFLAFLIICLQTMVQLLHKFYLVLQSR